MTTMDMVHAYSMNLPLRYKPTSKVALGSNPALTSAGPEAQGLLTEQSLLPAAVVCCTSPAGAADDVVCKQYDHSDKNDVQGRIRE